MRYNQFNEKYGEVFEKHIEEIEHHQAKKEKKSNRNKQPSEYASKYSTRISNQSSIIHQYTKENYEKLRREFEDKFGNSAPRSNATYLGHKHNLSPSPHASDYRYMDGDHSGYHSVRKLVHMDSEIDLNPSSAVSERGGCENIISPAVVISKRPNMKGNS